MSTFVLVHGAWHGGWCWRRVERLLRGEGHEVYTPTLTGLGERAHLMSRQIDLETHIADVLGVLRTEDLCDIVLCGHSYGGMVITGVADGEPERIAALVYLDAFVPENGQCTLDLLPADRREQFDRGVRERGFGWLVPAIPAAVYKVNEADQAWVDAQCTPHPLACFEQRLALTGAHETIAQRLYIRGALYTPSAFAPVAERLRRDPRWRVIDLPAGHDVMLDTPEELAALLNEAAVSR
jgi:pimeloyl-ACP methyl ester carboxylesterase